MEEFLDTYYLHVRPPYEVDSLSRLLDYQKSQEEIQQEMNSLFVQQMVKSFEQVLTPAFNRMTDGLNHVVDTFTSSQQEAVSQICATVVAQMRSDLDSNFMQIASTVSDLETSHRDYLNFMEESQKKYTDYMDQSMNRMLKTLSSMQDTVDQIGQYNTQSVRQLNEAHKEALHITQEQKATYQEYIRFMYQSIDKFSDVWEKNGQKMHEYAEEIAKLGPVQFNRELKEELHLIHTRLQAIEKHQRVSMLADDYTMEEDIVDMLRNTLRKLDDLEDMVSAPSLFRTRRKKNER